MKMILAGLLLITSVPVFANIYCYGFVSTPDYATTIQIQEVDPVTGDLTFELDAYTFLAQKIGTTNLKLQIIRQLDGAIIGLYSGPRPNSDEMTVTVLDSANKIDYVCWEK